METFVPALAMIALAMKLVDTLSFATNGLWPPVIKQTVAWVAGVGAVMAFAASDWASAIPVGSHTLDQLGWVSQVLAGVSLVSLGSVVVDIKNQTNPDPAVGRVVPPIKVPGVRNRRGS